MTEYKKQLATNTIWNALERYSVLGIQLLCTFILARFLTPADFGIVGMIVVFTAIANTIIDSGFSQALIRKQNVDNTEYSSVFYFNVIISVVLYILLFLFSGFIADFYHQPILKDICKITFLVIPCNALCIVQHTILMRNLQFKKLCIVAFIASFISCIVAIILAYFMKNVWVLVIQNLLTYFLKGIGLWLVTSWKPSLNFSLEAIKQLFHFSKNLLVSGLIGNVFNNIYSILIGHFYTATDLGYYSQADRIKNVASHNSTQVIQSVTYPILSQINNNGGDIKEAYRKIISITILFVGFMMTLLMSVSSDLLELLMGNPNWRIAGFYLFILSISGILYPLHAVNQNILLVKGNSRTVLILEILRRGIMLAILVVTLNFNVTIFVWGSALYSILLLFPNLYYCGKPIHYGLWEQLKDVLPIFIRFMIMILGTLLISQLYCEIPVFYRVLTTLTICLCIGYLLFFQNKYFIESQKLLLTFFKKK